MRAFINELWCLLITAQYEAEDYANENNPLVAEEDRETDEDYQASLAYHELAVATDRVLRAICAWRNWDFNEFTRKMGD